MRVLILGASGMLGHKLFERLSDRFEIYGTIRRSADLMPRAFDRDRLIPDVDGSAFETVERVIDLLSPDVVVNAVGVVKQLADSVVESLEINSILPHRLAEATSARRIRLITISTDCVFSGQKGRYKEDDIPDANDLYGISKRFGEPVGERVLVLRTSMIGRELRTRHGLVEWFLAQRGSVKGFRSAVFSGLTTVALSDVIGDVIASQPELSGLYHLSADRINKYELLSRVRDAFGLTTAIEPVDEPSIDRSLDSTRFRMLTGFAPPLWPEMIAEMAADRALYRGA